MDRKQDEIGRMLLDGVNVFLARQDAIARLRRGHHDNQQLDHSMWKLMAEAGWLGLRLPERVGGSALDLKYAEMIAHRFGRALLPEPYVPCAILPGALLAAVSAVPAADRLMAAIADGSSIVTATLEEPGTADLRIDHGDNGLSLFGRRRAVTADANTLLVCARLDGNPVIAVVPADAPGIWVRRQLMSTGTATAEFVFDGVHLAHDAMLCQGPDAEKAINAALREATVVTAALLAGIAEAAVQRTVDYLKQRIQFDQPLSGFQVLRHRVVDMALAVELTKAAVRRAVERFNGDATAATVAASAAKARASNTALSVCEAAVHLHGAMGYTAEADIGHYLDAALRWSSAFGNQAVHHRSFAARMNLADLTS